MWPGPGMEHREGAQVLRRGETRGPGWSLTWALHVTIHQHHAGTERRAARAAAAHLAVLVAPRGVGADVGPRGTAAPAAAAAPGSCQNLVGPLW